MGEWIAGGPWLRSSRLKARVVLPKAPVTYAVEGAGIAAGEEEKFRMSGFQV